MKNFGTVETARLMRTNELPPAGPVIRYQVEEEIETRIASNLQALIKADERDQRRILIQRIVIECCKELDKERVNV